MCATTLGDHERRRELRLLYSLQMVERGENHIDALCVVAATLSPSACGPS
jgi:hypothetical protein